MRIFGFSKSTKTYALLFLSCIAVGGFGQSSVSVNVSGAATVVNKEIFGILMEQLGKNWTNGTFVGTNSTTPNINGMRTDIINGLKECGVGAIQWPGGCAANGYNWSNNKNPSNDVGTDRFMQLCSLVTCSPILAGPPAPTSRASNMAWIRYVNENASHPTWTVNTFQVGNEVWGCGGNMNEASYEPDYTNQCDTLHQTINGKTMKLVAGTDLIGNNTWLSTMLSHIAAKIDYIEIHDYIYHPSDINNLTFSDAQYYTVLNAANEGQMRPRLDGLVTIMNQYDAGNRIKIWEGEWGDWLTNTGDGWQQTGTLMDALSAGETLNLFIRYCNRMFGAGLAQGVNVIHSLMNTNSAGALAKLPTFFVFKMYIPHHTNGAKYAPTTITSEKATGQSCNAVSAAATSDDLGHVNISLTNIDLTAVRTVNITLTSGVSSYAMSSAQIVTGPAKNSSNGFGTTETVNIQPLAASNYTLSNNGKTISATLPARSIVMLILGPTVPVNTRTIPKVSNDFSITTGPDGELFMTLSTPSKTPVTVSLYSTDGRTLVSKVPQAMTVGKRSLAVGRNIGKGIYIARISGEGFDLSKRIVVER